MVSEKLITIVLNITACFVRQETSNGLFTTFKELKNKIVFQVLSSVKHYYFRMLSQGLKRDLY